MSERETLGSEPSEIVVRVVVEQPVSGETKGSDDSNLQLAQAITALGGVVERLTQVTESLAVVDEADAEIVRRIGTFDKRLIDLAGLVEELREGLGKGEGTASGRISEADIEELKTYLEGKLEEMIEGAIAKAALRAVGPPRRRRPAVESAQLLPPPEISEEDIEKGTPDYMISDERLSTSAAISERIVLFLLDQPKQSYISPRQTAGKDIGEILEVYGDHNFNNALASLKREEVAWSKKESIRRTAAIGLDIEALASRGPGGFYTQRVHDKVTKTREQEDDSEDSEEGESSFEVSDEQRDLIMLIGEEETALITEDIKEIISEKFGKKGRMGNENIDYFMTDLQELIDRGLVRKLKYGNLEEYSLTPPGRAYYEKLAEAAVKGEEPPFLAEAQA